ncbi:MAG: hypothetical protein LBT05_07205 [Planctomycetaceae bacterium]|jgi:hypothetical protein|nr:hypothetical protein [Planctomycetaceae bacterium]
MKKETLKTVLIPIVCSGFWMLILTVVAQFWGVGFAQNPAAQLPMFPDAPQNSLPQNGLGYASQGMPIQTPPINQPDEQLRQFTPHSNIQNTLSNNVALPNQGQVTYNMTSGEVKVPFQLDTSRLLAFSAIVDNQWQTITVLDPTNQTLAVYQVSLLSNGQNAGKCYLRSVRNIAGDLKFDEYEATKPKPSEVRAIVEQKK